MDNKDIECRMIFSERLKTVRAKNNITQEILAEKLNVSVQLISKWENANSEPSLTQLNNLADIFNVSIDYLTGRTENEQMTNPEIYDMLSELQEVLQKVENLPNVNNRNNNTEYDKKLSSIYGMLSYVDIKKFLGMD